MGIISRCVCSAVRWADEHGGVPPALDAATANAAISAIDFYRRFLSPRTGVACLFRPTCSQRAIEALRGYGWNRGRRLMRAQIDRCRGEFSMFRCASGDITLIACDGMEFPGEQLSPHLTGVAAKRFP